MVEDDEAIATLIALTMRDEGYGVRVARDGREALDFLDGYATDVIVLDIMLPGPDGFAICEAVRSRPGYVPILMLTARSEELDRLLGLDSGADDYLTKPFSVRELQARVRALLRRADALAVPRTVPDVLIIRAGAFVIDLSAHTVSVGGRFLELTGKEFDLLTEFARHPGRAYSRSELLQTVWGFAHDLGAHTVNSHINRLRAKIEADPSRPRFIQTVRGRGYRFLDAPNVDGEGGQDQG